MKRLAAQFLRREAHPTVQFLKYGIAGCIATAVDIALFYVLALTVFPALQPDDRLLVVLDWLYQRSAEAAPAIAESGWWYDVLHFDVVPIAEEIRRRHYILNSCLVFLVSNLVAYVLNRFWVFTPGRHEGRVEIALFYLVSVISFVAGVGLAWGLIAFGGTGTTDAKIANMVAAVVINFLCRKYWVFRG
jgi:putative flippase GtrA